VTSLTLVDCLDSLVEELSSRLTRFNPLFAEAFKLNEQTAVVPPNANRLLKELLEYLCSGPALVSVREAHRYFPNDGKVALTALVRDVMPVQEDYSKLDFVCTHVTELRAGVNPREFLQNFQDSVTGAQMDLNPSSRFELGREDSIRLLLRRTCPKFYKAVHDIYTEEAIKTKPELTLVSCGPTKTQRKRRL